MRIIPVEAVRSAVDAGVKLINTAQNYGSEAALGSDGCAPALLTLALLRTVVFAAKHFTEVASRRTRWA